MPEFKENKGFKLDNPMGYVPFRMKAKDYGNSPMKKNYGEFGVGTPEAPKKVTAKSPNKFLKNLGFGGAAGGGFLTGIMGRNPKVKAFIEKMKAQKAQKQADAAAPEEDATAESAAAEDAAAAAEGAEAGAEGGGEVAPHGPEAHTGGVRPMKKGGFAGKIAGIFGRAKARPAGGIGAMFSDVRLKEKIQKTGVSASGIPIYEFNYIGSNSRYSGAMAQDLLEINPSAVTMDSSGYYKVNYNDIDVDMHQINN